MQRLSPAIQLIGLGSYVAVCIAGLTVGGYFLDEALETRPVFTLAGLSLGLVMALWGGYRMLMDTMRDVNRWQEQQAKQQPKK